MCNQTAHVLIASTILCLATFSFSRVTKGLLESFEPQQRDWLVAPVNFVALFSTVVLIRIFQPILDMQLAQLFLISSAVFGGFNLINRGYKDILKYLETIWFGVLPYLLFAVIALTIRGGLPFSVSDSWTHTSYINRISSSKSALIFGSHLPTDGKFLSFSPTSIFLSVLNDASGSDPIATWNAAAIFFGVLLLCASISFLKSLNLLPIGQSKQVFTVSIFFVVSYPAADLVSGWAGYSITGSIFLFVVLALIVRNSFSEFSKARTIIMLVIGMVMSINHTVESVTAVFMMVPLFILPKISKRRLVLNICSLILVSSIGGLASIWLLNPGVLVALDFSTPWPGTRFFLIQIKPFLDWKIFVSVILSISYLLKTRRFLTVKYFAACAVTIFLCGPWNPAIYPFWLRFMSLTLTYRVVYALPFWILFGTVAACILEDFRTSGRSRYSSILVSLSIFVSIFATNGIQLSEKFGMSGELSYYGSDKQSQLNALPELYRTVQKYDKRIILTDMWTGAPIPTISTNFIVVHRPWTSGVDTGRWAIGRETLKSLGSIQSHINMCKWDVDLVFLNYAGLPLMKRQFREAPWLLTDFYPTANEAIPTYLRDKGIINNVQILEFDKESCTNL
jgi:hypothetical protein